MMDNKDDKYDIIPKNEVDGEKEKAKINKNSNFALEICVDIASAIIVIIGCIGGLLIANDSVPLALASILLSLSITLILQSIKRLTIIELAIYEELKDSNDENNNS